MWTLRKTDLPHPNETRPREQTVAPPVAHQQPDRGHSAYYDSCYPGFLVTPLPKQLLLLTPSTKPLPGVLEKTSLRAQRKSVLDTPNALDLRTPRMNLHASWGYDMRMLNGQAFPTARELDQPRGQAQRAPWQADQRALRRQDLCAPRKQAPCTPREQGHRAPRGHALYAQWGPERPPQPAAYPSPLELLPNLTEIPWMGAVPRTHPSLPFTIVLDGQSDDAAQSNSMMVNAEPPPPMEPARNMPDLFDNYQYGPMFSEAMQFTGDRREASHGDHDDGEEFSTWYVANQLLNFRDGQQ